MALHRVRCHKAVWEEVFERLLDQVLRSEQRCALMSAQRHFKLKSALQTQSGRAGACGSMQVYCLLHQHGTQEGARADPALKDYKDFRT